MQGLKPIVFFPPPDPFQTPVFLTTNDRGLVESQSHAHLSVEGQVQPEYSPSSLQILRGIKVQCLGLKKRPLHIIHSAMFSDKHLNWWQICLFVVFVKLA